VKQLARTGTRRSFVELARIDHLLADLLDEIYFPDHLSGSLKHGHSMLLAHSFDEGLSGFLGRAQFVVRLLIDLGIAESEHLQIVIAKISTANNTRHHT